MYQLQSSLILNPTLLLNRIIQFKVCTNYFCQLVLLFLKKIFNHYSELYDPASVSFPAIEKQGEQTLANQFPYDAPSPPPDETFAYSAYPNQTNVLFNTEVCIIFIQFVIISIYFYFLGGS